MNTQQDIASDMSPSTSKRFKALLARFKAANPKVRLTTSILFKLQREAKEASWEAIYARNYESITRLVMLDEYKELPVKKERKCKTLFSPIYAAEAKYDVVVVASDIADELDDICTGLIRSNKGNEGHRGEYLSAHNLVKLFSRPAITANYVMSELNVGKSAAYRYIEVYKQALPFVSKAVREYVEDYRTKYELSDDSMLDVLAKSLEDVEVYTAEDGWNVKDFLANRHS